MAMLQCMLYACVVLFVSGCNSGPSSANRQTTTDTVYIHDTLKLLTTQDNWQEGFGLTHDPEQDSIWFKPVSFYISDKNCSAIAIDFYYGQLRPSDNRVTSELLKLAIDDNNKLRPFYRWCLNKTILIQDGALAEYTGAPARRYAEKFPKEFFTYMDVDSTGGKIKDWAAAINYSGFYEEDDHKNLPAIQKRMLHTMINNCIGCDKNLLIRIDSFSRQCF